ncbi:MAG: gliding motility-associated C-terminal domain-containing protein [Flavobacterium sp.]|nr:gliding motility-associated C-terminal domain-containing protein [Flavobacterium sp.]
MVFTPDAGQCASSQTLTVTISAPSITPLFSAIADFCFETTAPLLPASSQNSISGSWLPAVIDNTIVGTSTYTFTPTAGQCATVQTLTATVTAPSITPVFDAIVDFCAGTTAPLLQASSNNSISGSWLPATIDNTTVGTSTYTFTPTPGQCANVQTLTATVLPSITSDFAEIATICSGGVVPTLETTSPNGVVGTWTPDVINPAQGQNYTFTPAPNQCATGQTLAVTIANNPQFEVIGGCLNGNYTLSVTAADFDIETATYVWKYENNIISGQNNATIVVSQTGNYTCEVVYQGCLTEKPFIAISVSCTIQKGISPKGTGDGDGLNDYFDLEGQNVTKLEIFNRYGSKVYSKANYSKEWYGQTDGGDELPDGTYFYVIERNGEDSKTGWIYINHEL